MTRPPGLRLHSRTRIVQKAEIELREMFLSFWDEHDDLTDIEMAGIVLTLAPLPIKSALRAERHPDDPDRKADEE